MAIYKMYCRDCEKDTRHEKNINHILHLLLTLLTCGLWGVIWIFIAVTEGFHCDQCGRLNSKTELLVSKVNWGSSKKCQFCGAMEMQANTCMACGMDND